MCSVVSGCQALGSGVATRHCVHSTERGRQRTEDGKRRTEDSGRKQDLARARTVVETLDALKHSQDAKLLRVLQNEERLEEERAGMLAKVGTPEERYRLQKILGAERLAAGRRIAALTEAQKQELLGEQRRLEAESGFSLADCRVRKQRR